MAYDLGAIIAHVTADMSDFNNGLEKAKKEAKTFKEEVTNNLKVVGLAASVATAAIAAVAAVSFKLAEDAAQYNSIRDAFSSMTKGIVDDVDEFQSRVAKASGNTLDNLTILRGGTRALSLIGKESFTDFGKNFEEMAMLSKKAARATGMDVSFMFDSLILGVSRGSKLILDNLGINVSVEESYKKFADSVGKTSDQLTIQEQKAALLQGALTALHTNYDSVAVTSGGLQGATQILTAELSNLRIEIGQQLEPIWNQFIRTLLPLIQEYGPQLILLIQQTIQWFMNLDPNLRNIILVFLALIPVVAAVIGIILGLITILTALLNPFVLIGIGLTLLAATFLTQWTYISEIVTSNFNLLTATIMSGWNFIKTTFTNGVNFITDNLNYGLNRVRSTMGSIKDAIIGPFNDAWHAVEDIMNKIKNALDFTKRHSPSVLDIVKSGVGKVNDALSGLDYGITVTPHVQPSFDNIGGGNSINGVSIAIDMSGAVISDEMGANRIGEKIGDSIIKKLNTQVRF